MNGVLGEIRLFAGNRVPDQWQACEGQVLPISENEELFSVISAAFGGNGTTTFALPTIAPARTVEFSFSGVQYVMCTSGAWPLQGGMEGMLGEIRLWGGLEVPQGWALCDGSLLSVNNNQALFVVVGLNYGGDGFQTFGLPLLPNQSGARYLICIRGAFPLSAEDSDNAPIETTLAEIRLWGGTFGPAGFVILSTPVTYSIYDPDVESLYSLVGNDFGGNFPTNFQLPQLAPLQGNPGTSASYMCVIQGLYPNFF